jgi:DNA modification methylase
MASPHQALVSSPDPRLPVSIGPPSSRPCSLRLESVHSAKRGKHERDGIYSWHPYYAAYSEQFVRDVIQELAAPEGVIADPWNGCGTTTVTAQQVGCRSVGIEINPVMVVHARAMTAPPQSVGAGVEERANQVVQSALRHRGTLPPASDATYRYVEPGLLQPLLSLQAAILAGEVACAPHPLGHLLTIGSWDRQKFREPATAFLLSAVFQCLRRVGKFRFGSNPTWPVESDSGFEGGYEDVLNLFLERVQAMIQDVSRMDGQFVPDRAALILQGNVKDLPLVDSAVDLIITSPPYCTRIDYTMSTGPELALLGCDPESVVCLRRATMGAPVVTRRDLSPADEWGPTCMDLLRGVEAHPSKASKSYYLLVLQQYFHDAFCALKEVRRVLKPGGHAVLVVQSSYYKEIEVQLAQIYLEMARSLSLQPSVVKRHPVHQHMAHMNSRSRQYVNDKTYFEDVLLLHNPKVGGA